MSRGATSVHNQDADDPTSPLVTIYFSKVWSPQLFSRVEVWRPKCEVRRPVVPNIIVSAGSQAEEYVSQNQRRDNEPRKRTEVDALPGILAKYLPIIPVGNVMSTGIGNWIPLLNKVTSLSPMQWELISNASIDLVER